MRQVEGRVFEIGDFAENMLMMYSFPTSTAGTSFKALAADGSSDTRDHPLFLQEARDGWCLNRSATPAEPDGAAWARLSWRYATARSRAIIGADMDRPPVWCRTSCRLRHRGLGRSWPKSGERSSPPHRRAY